MNNTPLCPLYPRYPIFQPFVKPHITTGGTPTTTHQNGFTPDQLREIYSLEPSFTGAGTTVAVIEAFYNNFLRQDLQVFSDTFSLGDASLTIEYPDGKADYTLQEWINESSLDVQWIHALAPRANILALFAKSNSMRDMFSCVRYAVSKGADVICMSFGSGEFLSQSEYNSSMSSSESVFVASAGDTGGIPVFPSCSKMVLSVGGTSFDIQSNTVPSTPDIQNQSAWRFGGGGPSKYESIPVWQSIFDGISGLSGQKRATPDCAFYADTDPGVCIYMTEGPYGKGWVTSGGTSFACTALSAICACILQQRPASLYSNNMARYFYTLAGATNYNIPQNYFDDVTRGGNSRFSARVGWDFCTGLGTPKTSAIISG